MNLLECIKEDYQSYVKNALINSELKRALKTQERIPLFFSNLAKSLKSKKDLSREDIRLATYDLTQMFIESVDRVAKENYLSTLAKETIKEEAKKQAAVDALKNKVGQSDGAIEYDG